VPDAGAWGVWKILEAVALLVKWFATGPPSVSLHYIDLTKKKKKKRSCFWLLGTSVRPPFFSWFSLYMCVYLFALHLIHSHVHPCNTTPHMLCVYISLIKYENVHLLP
jgi:hypothetical protein